jgi:hypothetical protein
MIEIDTFFIIQIVWNLNWIQIPLKRNEMQTDAMCIENLLVILFLFLNL